MEIKSTSYKCRVVRICTMLLWLVLFTAGDGFAQPPVRSYTVKNGRMYIALGKKLQDASIDSFITQYDLQDLSLKTFIKGIHLDSLAKLGWKLNINNSDLFVISKPLMGVENLTNPAEKIIMAEKKPNFAEIFPAVSNLVTYGVNRFKRKYSFNARDSVVTFYLRNYTSASLVRLAGSFNDWSQKSLAMQETDDEWQLPVYLADGTHTYRFIVDGKWMTDPGNPQKLPNEFNDFNSVIRIGKPYLFRLEGFQQASQVVLTGSFNKWRKDELFMEKKAGGWQMPYTLGPGNYEYTFLVDGRPARPAGSNSDGNMFFIIEPNFTFRLKGFAAAQKVVLAGDFNNWSPNAFVMKKEGDEWVLNVHLSTGKHLYKFVVDGKWIMDPGNKLWEQNEHSTGNSIVWMGDEAGAKNR